MQILLCAATELEIMPTLQWLQQQDDSKKIALLITGVGSSVTTYQLTKSLQTQKPSLVIQAGLAGSFSPLFPLTEVVVVEKDCFGDVGVWEEGLFRSVHDLDLKPANEPPFSEGWLPNPHNELLQSSGLVSVTGTTVNEITTMPERITHYQATGAQIESMEGAALHYTALMEKVPFIQLRAVSNLVGERDKTKWALTQSVQRLNEELQRILHKLSMV